MARWKCATAPVAASTRSSCVSGPGGLALWDRPPSTASLPSAEPQPFRSCWRCEDAVSPSAMYEAPYRSTGGFFVWAPIAHDRGPGQVTQPDPECRLATGRPGVQDIHRRGTARRPLWSVARMHFFRYIIGNGGLSRKEKGGQAHARVFGVVAGRRAFFGCSRGCECANTATRGGRRVI